MELASTSLQKLLRRRKMRLKMMGTHSMHLQDHTQFSLMFLVKITKKLTVLFSCEEAALEVLMSLCLSVRVSVTKLKFNL